LNPQNLFILLLSLFCTIAFNQIKSKTNLEIIEETIRTGLETYIYYPDLNREYQFIFAINPEEKHENSSNINSKEKYLTALVKKIATDNKLHFSFATDIDKINSDSAYNLVVLHINNIETAYPQFKKNKFLGNKTLIRNIQIKIAVDIKSSDNKFSLSDFIIGNYNDEVDYDGYEKLESSQYTFTKAEPPEVGSFESIVFPLMLVSATAVATFLFFIIRSK
jgi:hypothetical protein